MPTRSRRVLVGLALGLLVGSALAVEAQGPYSAQIQRALAAYLAAAHTWTGVQTAPTFAATDGTASFTASGGGDYTTTNGGAFLFGTRLKITATGANTLILGASANGNGVAVDFSTGDTFKCRNKANNADCTFTAGAGTFSGTVTVPTALTGVLRADAGVVSVDAANAVSGVAAAYKIARGATAFDGSNPTTVATGLASVVSCTATLRLTAQLTTGTAFVTHAIASGANVDFYAWVLAGTASTGTETFEWICVGT